MLSTFLLLKQFAAARGDCAADLSPTAFATALLWDVEVETKNLEHLEHVRRFCEKARILPFQTPRATRLEFDAAFERPFTDAKAVELKMCDVFTRAPSEPLLALLGKKAQALDYVLTFPRPFFSYLYLVRKLGEFASLFLPFASPSRGCKRDRDRSAKEVAPDCYYAIVPYRMRTSIYCSSNLAMCVLSVLAAEALEHPKARLDFLMTHLPVLTCERLSLGIALSQTMPAPQVEETLATDPSKMRLLMADVNVNAMPQACFLKTGMYTPAAVAFDAALVWTEYSRHQPLYTFDLTSKAALHGFEVDADDLLVQGMCTRMLNALK